MKYAELQSQSEKKEIELPGLRVQYNRFHEVSFYFSLHFELKWCKFA